MPQNNLTSEPFTFTTFDGKIEGLRGVQVPQAWGNANDRARQDYDRRTGGCAGNDECVVCGRKVNAARAWAVHFVEGGSVALHKDDEERYDNDAADMGWWALGSECATALPVEYRHRYSEVMVG